MAAPKGNQNAAKAKQWLAAIERALDKRALKKGKKTRAEALDELAENFLSACDEGNLMALKELADRLDGKPAQSVDLSGGLSIEKRAQDLSDDELAAIVAANGSK